MEGDNRKLDGGIGSGCGVADMVKIPTPEEKLNRALVALSQSRPKIRQHGRSEATATRLRKTSFDLKRINNVRHLRA